MGSKYDENLAENVFFKRLHEDHFDIVKKASKNRWIVCVPRAGSCDKESLTLDDILEHILVGNDNSPPHYHTLKRKEVNVHNNILIIKTDSVTNTIRILFNEVFYVGACKYTVWCVEGSLNQKFVGNVADIVEVHDLRDCIELLWTDNLGYITLGKINDVVDSFVTQHKLLGLDLQEQKELIKNLYERCLEVTLSNENLRSKSDDVNFLSNLQLSVETYMQTCLNKRLFGALYRYTSFTDANFNKIIRNVQDLPLRAFDVSSEFYEYLPLAKYELNKINRCCTTLDKLRCLKCTLDVLSDSNNKTRPLTAESLLQIFIFLIIKSSVHNWITNLVFIREFRFSTRNACDENNFLITTLQAAVEFVKSGELIRKLVDFDLAYDSTQNTSGCDLRQLFRYIYEGNLAKTAGLLTNTSDQQQQSLKLCHPLCSCDRCENLLIKNNACEVNSCDDRGRTPLHFACKSGHLNVIDFLIEKGANINSADCSGCTPLHYAVSKGHQQAALLLLHSGSSINASGCEGNTPLHVAVRNGHENCAKMLLYSSEGRNEIHVNCANASGDTPLHFASKFGYVGLVKLLIQHGAKIKRNKGNLTPGDVAHNESVVALLAYAINDEGVVEQGKRRSSLQENPNRYLHESDKADGGDNVATASRRRKVDVKRWASFSVDGERNVKRNFVNFGVRPKNLDQFKKTDLLMKAIENNDLPLTCFYLGIPLPNVTSNVRSNCHPLCTCDKCGEQLVEITNGDAVKQTDSLNFNICNSEGFTPLHVASKYGRSDILRLLLDAGALINLKTYKTFYTPLHLACIHQRIRVVRELLKCGGCNVDVPDSEGNTPLHYACFKNDTRIFELLLSQGADVNVKNNCGKTVLSEARESLFFNIVKILKEQDESLKAIDSL